MNTVMVRIWYVDGDELQCFRTLVNGSEYKNEEEIREMARNFWHDYKFDVQHPIHKIQVIGY